MEKTLKSNNHSIVSAQPRLHQSAPEIQAYGTVSHLLPLELEEPVRLEMTERLNQLLADTITLRDLYKKSHWQVAGPTFYQLHLLFDKHFEEQSNLVDAIAERIQLLGGISLAMAPDVSETTRIARPPPGAAKKCRCNCLDCSMHTKSLSGTAAASHPARRSWAMTGPMIWSSARPCEATNCKRGSLASTWSICRLLRQKADRASRLRSKRFVCGRFEWKRRNEENYRRSVPEINSGRPEAKNLLLGFIFGRDGKLLLDLQDFLRCMLPEKTLHIRRKFAQKIRDCVRAQRTAKAIHGIPERSVMPWVVGIL